MTFSRIIGFHRLVVAPDNTTEKKTEKHIM
jgi:hypothetical protein